MVYTEYDPLEEVIVADSYLPGDLDHLFPNQSLTSFNRILEETKQDFDNLADFLTKGSITVTRPQVMKYPNHISMSGFNVNFPMGPTVPRDQYKVLGTTILQTYTSLTDRYFDCLSFYKIFSDLFAQGYNWISQPSPPLVDVTPEDLWYVNGGPYRSKLKDRLLFHTATMFPIGDKIIINSKGPGNDLGFEWLKRNLPEFTFIENQGTRANNFGHIDHGFIMVDDETVIHGGIEWVPLSLRHLKLIDVEQHVPKPNTAQYKQDYITAGGRYNLAWVDRYLDNWRGYNQDVCFDLNVLVIDKNNLLFARALPDLFTYLKQFGIECHVCEQRHMLYWEGGIHCSTLDIKRRGRQRSII